MLLAGYRTLARSEMTSINRSAPETETLISPAVEGLWAQTSELWRQRELAYFLTWKEVKVRYKQTIIGAAWAVLQPFTLMIVFALFFGRLAHIPSEGIPYPLFYFCALVPWTYLSTAVTQSTNSLASNQNLVQKVYFPRLLLPLSNVAAGLLDLVIALALLGAMVVYYGYGFRLTLLWLPVFTAVAVLTAAATSVWTSALNAVYRDLRYAVPVALQLWLFVSPVAYPTSLVPPAWRFAYELNPMAGVVEGFRWCLTGAGTPPGLPFATSVLIALLVLLGGLRHFRRSESTLADVV